MGHRLAGGLLLALLVVVLAVPNASAHGFSSVVYADVTGVGEGRIAVSLKLEYDLLVVSAADAQGRDDLFQDGTSAFESHDIETQAAVLARYQEPVMSYVAQRFTVSTGEADCPISQTDEATVSIVDGVPYAEIAADAVCPGPADGHIITSHLFPDEDGYVRDTKTILTYDLDLQQGSAALDEAHPSVSTHQTTAERFWSFFTLGADHLLGGLDHILFLAALIVGSRRLREVVLAATTFTVAHSLTFIMAATGLVSVPERVVEPVIALSIAVVAAWYLLRLWQRGELVDDLSPESGPLGVDRAGWLRLGVIFIFGLVHGMGFASALGINEAWSWRLLWSLLVFNLGIEAVQLGLILLFFPILTLMRRKAPRTERWISALIASTVAVAGTVWFVQRLGG